MTGYGSRLGWFSGEAYSCSHWDAVRSRAGLLFIGRPQIAVAEREQNVLTVAEYPPTPEVSMPTLTVTMLIEFDRPLVFHQWIPAGEHDAIVFDDTGIILRIWFDVQCATWVRQPTPEEIARTTNVNVYRVHGTAICDISTQLENLLLRKPASDADATDPDAEAEYRRIGTSLHAVSVQRVNRLIEYAFSFKRQYWARRLYFDEKNPGQFFIKANATAYLNDNRRFRFDPDKVVRLTAAIPNSQHIIGRSEWEGIKAFVVSNQRPPLIGNLLSRARELASEGYERASILEAVSALEISLDKFAREHDGLIPEHIKNRLENGRLSKLIEKIGLRAAFGTIVPLLLTEEDMPSVVLEQCRAAIETRNSVVHQGQREIGEPKLRAMLTAIEECCSRFDSLKSRAAKK